jgi:hypothetical protein
LFLFFFFFFFFFFASILVGLGFLWSSDLESDGF